MPAEPRSFRLDAAEACGLHPGSELTEDKTAKVHFDERVSRELCSLRFIEDARNVVILGPVGVGKTFLATGLGHLGCRSRFNVRFHRADDLLRRLRETGSTTRETRSWRS